MADPIISISTPVDSDKVKVTLRSMRGEEQISALFQFSLELLITSDALDFSKIVGQGVTISIKISDTVTRYIHGLVGRFVQAGTDTGGTTYFAEIYPWLWLLTLSTDCRIWQNKSVKDIVTGLFSELGFTDYQDTTKGQYAALEYCVQYNESHFAFVSRLMESAGIFYFFQHANGKHTLILGDDSTAFTDCPGGATVTYSTTEENAVVQNVVTACTLEQTMISGAYAVNDFNFETPATKLSGSTTSTVEKNATSRRIYEYPAGHTKQGDAENLSKLRMQEHEVRQQLLRGTGLVAAFVAGGKTTLQSHYRANVNTAYVLLRVAHASADDKYSNSFDAFPAANTYKPPRLTRKPFIPGTQTAIVVGPSGEEISTDKYGRVKVQFPWDQLGTNDENSSCWIRVVQGWAGTSWGAFFLPRVGQEVVVTFLEGNPDRPLITGSVCWAL
jgi:type VI secretion system secreted protein VgrG